MENQRGQYNETHIRHVTGPSYSFGGLWGLFYSQDPPQNTTFISTHEYA